MAGKPMQAIRHALTIRAPREMVYRAITEAAGLGGWWTPDSEVATEVGGVSTFRFRSGAFNRMRVSVLQPHRRVQWECVDGAAEWIGTTVNFELEECGGGTKLLFEHGNWKQATVYMAECSFHWAHYLRSLERYCETGRGCPDRADSAG